MSTVLLNEEDIANIQTRLVGEILEKNNPEDLMLVGIERRGADLAGRLASDLELKSGKKIAHGTLDINLYRDDWTCLSGGSPHIGKSSIPQSTEGKKILLIDDVLFSGRTIRAALEAILDYGRPLMVELLVLIDRGHRELPIYAKYVGKYIETAKESHIDVLFKERDGKDAVILTTSP